jgi:hypothetical protein
MTRVTRLHKKDGVHLADLLERVHGYYIQTRPVGNPAVEAIYIWQDNPDKTRHYLGCLRWIVHEGWRLELALPPIHTETELTIAFGQLRKALSAKLAGNIAWDHYLKDRNKASWQTYLGIIAAFYMGCEDDKRQD